MYGSYTTAEVAVQEQKKFLVKVHGWMGLAVLLTAFAAFFTSKNEFLEQLIFGNPFGWLVLVVGEVALVWFLSARVFRLSFETGLALFTLYSVLNGVTLSAVFLVYSLGSIAGVFFISAGMFFAMSLYGWVTKADLSKWGSILFMALIGVIIASVVNFFLHSGVFQTIISFVGVLVFVGLTAYDSFRLRRMQAELAGDTVMLRKLGLLGALSLYLDFINLFLMMLQLFGGRRNS
ncbi:MAG: Bax inhibitor-1/YccA family protein [Spirochaetales bacterium]|nr:Bax inhibitor-1/YccA family protein [Spirochaetales bacterium]